MLNNKPKTLGSLLQEENNFHLIRLFAAIFVIITHSYAVRGMEERDFLYVFVNYRFSYVGLICFFYISGLLVTKSVLKSPTLKNYFWKRFLRIYPALWVLFFLFLFLIGPIISSCSLNEYFFAPEFWDYLKGASLLGVEYYIPCLFQEGYDKSVNPSLWTLPVELKLYLALGIAHYFRLFDRKLLVVCCILLVVFIKGFFFQEFWDLFNALPFLQVRIGGYVIYGSFFGLGCLSYLYKDKIIIDNRLSLFLLIFSIPLIVYKYNFFFDNFILPYLILALAFADLSRIKHFFPKGDYSYGIYIYAYPVQQILVQYFGTYLNEYTMIISSILCSFVPAYYSWHWVEKRALKYKYRV